MAPTYDKARTLAWVNMGSTTIHLASDVERSASRNVLRYLAYHEVCHLKLGHHLRPVPNKEWIVEMYHVEVDACVQKFLPAWQVLKKEYDDYGKLWFGPVRKKRFGKASFE